RAHRACRPPAVAYSIRGACRVGLSLEVRCRGGATRYLLRGATRTSHSSRLVHVCSASLLSHQTAGANRKGSNHGSFALHIGADADGTALVLGKAASMRNRREPGREFTLRLEWGDGLVLDHRGASLVEYIIVIAVIALVACAAFRVFGIAVLDKTERDAACIASLSSDCSRGSVIDPRSSVSSPSSGRVSIASTSPKNDQVNPAVGAAESPASVPGQARAGGLAATAPAPASEPEHQGCSGFLCVLKHV